MQAKNKKSNPKDNYVTLRSVPFDWNEDDIHKLRVYNSEVPIALKDADLYPEPSSLICMCPPDFEANQELCESLYEYLMSGKWC